MPKPLSINAPAGLAPLLLEKYSDLTDLALQNGLEPRTVQQVFADNGNKSIRAYKKMADALGVSLLDIYTTFTADDISAKREWLENAMRARDIPSQRYLARICGLSHATISDILRGKNNCSNLHTYKAVSDGLGVKMDRLAELF